MTATLAEIQDALANIIRNQIEQVTDVDVQIEPRVVVNPTYPCVDMYPGEPAEDPDVAAFGDLAGGDIITIRARATTGDSYGGQDVLLGLYDTEDPLSLIAAVNYDPTIGGLAADVDVRTRTGWSTFGAGDASVIGFLLGVLVIRARS